MGGLVSLMTRTIQSVSLTSLYESEKNLTIDKHKANRENKLERIALLMKLSSMSIAVVLLAIVGISIFSIRSMRTASLKPVISIGKNILANDMVYFANRLSTEYGQLSTTNA